VISAVIEVVEEEEGKGACNALLTVEEGFFAVCLNAKEKLISLKKKLTSISSELFTVQLTAMLYYVFKIDTRHNIDLKSFYMNGYQV
jgi:hypothetical protein